MKTYDLKEKPSQSKPVPVLTGYPTLYLTTDQFPPLKGKQLGERCRIEITAEVAGMDQHDDRPPSYRLEIVKAAALHGKGKSTREDY